MTADDIKVIKNPGSVRDFQVSDWTVNPVQSTTFKYGEPVLQCPGGQFVTKMTTGKPVVGTDLFLGIATETSDETTSADGTVKVVLLTPTTVLRGTASSTGNMTAANLLTYRGKYVAFDVSSDAFTIDEDEASDPNVHGLYIIAGDVNFNTLDVIPQVNATFMAPTV